MQIPSGFYLWTTYSEPYSMGDEYTLHLLQQCCTLLPGEVRDDVNVGSMPLVRIRQLCGLGLHEYMRADIRGVLESVFRVMSPTVRPVDDGLGLVLWMLLCLGHGLTDDIDPSKRVAMEYPPTVLPTREEMMELVNRLGDNTDHDDPIMEYLLTVMYMLLRIRRTDRAVFRTGSSLQWDRWAARLMMWFRRQRIGFVAGLLLYQQSRPGTNVMRDGIHFGDVHIDDCMTTMLNACGALRHRVANFRQDRVVAHFDRYTDYTFMFVDRSIVVLKVDMMDAGWSPETNHEFMNDGHKTPMLLIPLLLLGLVRIFGDDLVPDVVDRHLLHMIPFDAFDAADE